MRKLETMRFGGPVKVLVMGIALLTGAALVILAFASESETAEKVLLVAIGAGIIALAALIVYLPRLDILFDGSVLSLNMVPLRKYQIPIEEIQNMRAVDVNAASFGGVGLRFRPGMTGLIMQSGRGVKFRHGEREMVFSSSNPEHLINALSRSIPPAPR